jgi:hypothetical protein
MKKCQRKWSANAWLTSNCSREIPAATASTISIRTLVNKRVLPEVEQTVFVGTHPARRVNNHSAFAIPRKEEVVTNQFIEQSLRHS